MNLSTKNVIVSLVFFFIAAIIFATWYFSSFITQTDSHSMDYLKNTGEVRIGMNVVYPRMSIVDEHNKVSGYDVDLAMQIARELGLEADIVMYTDALSNENIYSALEQDKVDLLISSISEGAQYPDTLSASRPYTVMTQDNVEKNYVMLVRKNEPDVLEAVNRALAQLHQHGVIDTLQKKWFSDQ